MNVLTNKMLTSMMTDLTQAAAGVAGILHGAQVQPFIAPHTPLPTSVLADFTVSADANLAPQAITWGASHNVVGGGVAIDGNAALWQLALIGNACIIYGFLVLDSGGTNLLFAEVLANPVNLNTLLAGVVYVPQFADGAGNNGAGTVVP